MLKVTILGSGSSGNSALVATDSTRLLVDAGLSAKQIRLRLDQAGVSPEDLDGILISHEHGDHVRGLDVFCKDTKVPIYCNQVTRESLGGILKREMKWKLVPNNGEFAVGDIGVRTFSIPHDAVDPVGFVLTAGAVKFGILSDLGHITNLVREHVRDVHGLFIEANFDPVLLEQDSKRPWSVKQRIQSRHGHLSNQQVLDLLKDIAHCDLSHVILGHLSSDCNEADLVFNCVKDCLSALNISDVHIACASQDTPTDSFRIASLNTADPSQSSKLAEEAKVAKADSGAQPWLEFEQGFLAL